jgi:DNA helicase INO80
MKETQSRAKRLTREMVTYWKRFEKVEKEHRKRAEKEALEQRKMDLELREVYVLLFIRLYSYVIFV